MRGAGPSLAMLAGSLLFLIAPSARATLPAPSCAAAPAGTAVSNTPVLLATLSDQFHEAWLGSPAVADLDGDGSMEILAARHSLILGWNLAGNLVFRVESNQQRRFWSPPVVADLDPTRPGLEVAAAAGDHVYVWNAAGVLLPGFPATWLEEIRSIAAADIDGDDALELVVTSTSNLSMGGERDIVMAFEINGDPVAGFPPNTSGASGCAGDCFVFGAFDQAVALGDVNGDGIADIVAPHDNSRISVHTGDGSMFDAAAEFSAVSKFAGVGAFFDVEDARRGFAFDEDTALQSIFTNSAPAIADIDGDGSPEIIILGSAQNNSQTNRLMGVALWVLRADATRLTGWETPLHISEYIAGLSEIGNNNLVSATNQVSVADIDPASPGLELVFAGFDGKIHAVSSAKQILWSYTYATTDRVLTGGVAIADLSGDGVPEVIFNSYSIDDDGGHLFVLGADGSEQHKLQLPMRGAMPVPTVADVDGDGDLEIVVSLKDAVVGVRQVLVYTVPGSIPNCMPWPTGRGNLQRTGTPIAVSEPTALTAAGTAVAVMLWIGTLRRRGGRAAVSCCDSAV